jgi:hypothetical protein
VSVSWVNPDLVLEVQSNPYGTTYSGNPTDKIAEQSTLTFSLDNDTHDVPTAKPTMSLPIILFLARVLGSLNRSALISSLKQCGLLAST